MKKANRFVFYVHQKSIVWAVAALLLCALSYEVISETMTLMSYYPSPVGVYKNLRSTQDVYLAYQGGKVGIGTDTPDKKFHVSGETKFDNELEVTGDFTLGGTLQVNQDIQVGGVADIRAVKLGDGGVCDDTWKGKLAYRDNSIKYCDGSDWSSLTVEVAEFQEIEGDNPVCPKGTKEIQRYWLRNSCSRIVYAAADWCSYGRQSCTTGTGWFTTAPKCGYLYQPAYASKGCYTLWCHSNKWTKIQCVRE